MLWKNFLFQSWSFLYNENFVATGKVLFIPDNLHFFFFFFASIKSNCYKLLFLGLNMHKIIKIIAIHIILLWTGVFRITSGYEGTTQMVLLQNDKFETMKNNTVISNRQETYHSHNSKSASEKCHPHSKWILHVIISYVVAKSAYCIMNEYFDFLNFIWIHVYLLTTMFSVN